jgi:integrase
MPLTDSQIKATKHNPERRVTLTDGHGLQLRISQTDRRSWSFQYRFHGVMKKLTIGAWPSVKCRDARQIANEARNLIAKGIDPQVEKRKAKEEKQTLADVWLLYDQMHIASAVKVKTARDYRRNAERDILPVLGKLLIEEIDRIHVVRLLDRIAKRAPILANRTQSLLHHFFGWCVGRGHIINNPAMGIPRQPEQSRGRVLSVAEMRNIYKAASHLSAGNRLLVELLFFTAQRVGVIAKLTNDEIHSDHLEIAGARNKSGERILVPLSEIAHAQIKELGCLDGPYVVSTTNGEKPISGFSKLKKRLDELSGVTDWRFHDIRRGIATHLEDNGLDRFYIERLLTHKDRSVTGIYARSNHIGFRRKILQQWASVLTSKDGTGADNVVSFTGGVA